MLWLYILISAALIFQVVLFIMGRRIRKQEKENNVLLKYDIKTRQRAWQLMGDTSIPEEDREKIREIYEKEEE